MILVYITVVAIGASFKVSDMFCFFVVVVDTTLVFIAFVVIVFKRAPVLVAAIFVLVLKEDKDKKLWLQFQILLKTCLHGFVMHSLRSPRKHIFHFKFSAVRMKKDFSVIDM